MSGLVTGLLALGIFAQPLPAEELVKPLERDDEINWAKEKNFWSFRAPVMPARPPVKNSRWPNQELDFFILNRLEQKGLSPSQESDKETLLRRVTLDLTGLPPSPQEVHSFLKDKRSNAYERQVDRLLSAPQFGERMASMWLPLARYAEDQAHQVGEDTKYFYPNAYKYRDWVIKAFNRDLPYDTFIQLQLAADKISNVESNDLAALGFLGLGPKYYNRDRLEVMADEWEDRVDTVTRTFLGLTVACARCHDHKFDPITREDYYGLAGVFASTKMVNQATDGTEEKLAKGEKMKAGTLHMVGDDKSQDLNIFIRGNVERKGSVAPRQFLRLFSNGETNLYTEGSGRKELAADITHPKNPLTARVMVNRLWGNFFGKPIVDTPSNFGHSGQPPSHPELLDFLALQFQKDGLSTKKLVRQMVLSSTYRQTSRFDPEKAAVDSDNAMLWRMNPRRLSIEQWRDSILFVSGELNLTGSRSLELQSPTNLNRTVYARISRLQLNPLLMQFDYPDANVHAEKRSSTTTAMQKLFALNSSFMLARAKSLSTRLTENNQRNETERVRDAYRLLFAREPDTTELKLALDFLRKPQTEHISRWEQYSQMLLASNEMLYVD